MPERRGPFMSASRLLTRSYQILELYYDSYGNHR